MSNSVQLEVTPFLEECQKSSQHSFEQIKKLLENFENTSTQKETRCFFTTLEKHLSTLKKRENIIEKYHFSLEKLSIGGNEESNRTLLLLQLPSTFAPEEWSFTFYEGLSRYQNEEFFSRTLAELGCGNGWISIALAKKGLPQQIYGLDINPRAIVCARVNLFLNALNETGDLQFDAQGKTLLDRVQFHESDLLEYCSKNNIGLDKIIGCIPQVLAPDANLISNITPDNATDEALYALSNYCEKQGYIEDQFGLGLIARALEESIELLKPSGKIILNLGGRPGKAVLDRLFKRRGCIIRTIWQTKIEQAADTEIIPLVEIEKNSFHRFEFFMSVNSTESVSARTALAYAQQGGQIYHSLKVIEATVSDGSHIKKILTLLKQKEYLHARSALDLDYNDHTLVNEKISFLSKLADKMNSLECFPYEETRGDIYFRRRIAEFFRIYWRVPLTVDHVFIAPSRACLVKNLFTLYGIKKALVEPEICRYLPHQWLENDVGHTSPDDVVVLEAPHQIESICKLVESFRPQLVVCALSSHEISTSHAFVRLMEITQRLSTRLVIDFSNQMELSSFVKTNGIFEYLSEQDLPRHVSLICALIHNRLYPDLEVTFCIGQNENLMEHLEKSAELTYSRAPLLAQEYYSSILFDLLSFHLKNTKRENILSPHPQANSAASYSQKFDDISQNCTVAFSHPALQCSSLTFDKNTVRLDYGENSLATPKELKACLVEGLVRQHISKRESQLEGEIAKTLCLRFGFSKIDPQNIFLANGISSLFSGIAEFCKQSSAHLLFPSGAYGHFLAAAQYFGTSFLVAPTKKESGFKLTAEILSDTFNKNSNKKFFIFLNAPVVNPTGQIYSQKEVEEIFEIAAKHDSTVVLDTIFSGLEFDAAQESQNFFKNPKTDIAKKHVVLLGGISKEFAAGGLRLGYALTENPLLQKHFSRGSCLHIPVTLRYGLTKFFSLLNSKQEELAAHLDNQKRILKQRSEILFDTLQKNGWEPMPCFGGLFLIAKPKELVGKTVTLKINNKTETWTLDGTNIHQAIFYKTGLLVNGSQWTGIADHCRFVLSVTEQDFQSALHKICSFWEELK